MGKDRVTLIQRFRDWNNARRLRRALQKDPESALEIDMLVAWRSNRSVRVNLDGDGNPIEVQVGSVTVGRRRSRTR